METDCRSWLLIAVLALTGAPALAELSAADYGADEGASSADDGEAERRRAQARLEAARHTWIGWSLTVVRMRLLNGAILPDADAALVRDHLARIQPASRAVALLEYGLAALAVLLPLGWILWRRLRRVADNRRPGYPLGPGPEP